MKYSKMMTIALGVLIGLIVLPSTVVAQGGGRQYHKEAYQLDSRAEGGEGSEAAPFQTQVQVTDAPWLRLLFSEANLGQRSYILITSALDGGQQKIDAATLAQWNNSSAYFNGDTLQVELHVAPGEQDIYFKVDEVMVGEQAEVADDEATIESICGPTDNRAPSADNRVARLTFVNDFTNQPVNACTAWLTSNGSVLTAGHCVDFDPDQGGPQLPDGVLDLDANDVIEFNPPNSLASGALVFANPNNQYLIQLGSVTWNFDGEGQGLGKDWAVFDVFGNTNSSKGPHQVQGFFRTTNGNPAAGNNIRITGYGTDATPNLTRNQIQQTHSGGYTSENSSGANIWHRYQVDTTGGSSGSPIIWDSNQFTVGIHTNAGCSNPAAGTANSGTSFEHNPLEIALDNFPGGNTVYADKVRFGALENGTVFHPFDTVTEAVNAASSGAIISVVQGGYGETITMGADGKSFVIEAPVGNVVIGN